MSNPGKFKCLNANLEHDFLDSFGEEQLEQRLINKAAECFEFKMNHYRSEAKAGVPLKPDIQNLFEMIEEQGEEEVIQRLDLGQFLESQLASENWQAFN